MVGSAVKSYRKTEIETADPGKLVVMMYDQAIQCLRLAKERLEAGDYEAKGKLLLKAEEIILELSGALNPEAGQIANLLKSLYAYMIKRILEANVNKDVAAIDEVAARLSELKEAWYEITIRPAATEPEKRLAAGLSA